MKALLKKLLPRLFWPKDPIFKQRAVSELKFGNWLLVEMGANEYVVLMDLLSGIQLSEADDQTKLQQLAGLRYMALAMSVRTRSGRMPLNHQNKEDLMWLGTLPFQKILEPLQEVARLSGIPWLAPNYEAESQQQGEVEVLPPTAKEIEQNPS